MNIDYIEEALENIMYELENFKTPDKVVKELEEKIRELNKRVKVFEMENDELRLNINLANATKCSSCGGELDGVKHYHPDDYESFYCGECSKSCL